MYIGGDQNPLRQGFLRAWVMAQKFGPDKIIYFVQDADTIIGGVSEIWGLAVARTTYFPFCWDLWGHPEYPGGKLGKDEPEHAQNQARVRDTFGYSRLIVVGPNQDLVQSAVASYQKNDLWEVIKQAFTREINWALGLHDCPPSRQRAEEIMRLVTGHKGSLTQLVFEIGWHILPDLSELELGTLSSFYQNYQPKVSPENCWVISEKGERRHYQEGTSPKGILVPKGRALIDDLQARGLTFFGTNIPYLEKKTYVRVHFDCQLPVDWSKLMKLGIGAGWQEWRGRPTMIALYILGGHPLVNKILKSARVEGV